jgi:hypothetical protein
MEGRVMRPVHRVFSIHITQTEEGIIALLLHKWNLMNRSVRTKASVFISVESVGRRATDMILGNKELVKAILCFDEGVKVLEHLEILAWNHDV